MNQARKEALFLKVAKHLITQGKPAWNPKQEYCAYRAPDGTRCAIGAMIPDALYDPEIEGLGMVNMTGSQKRDKLFREVLTKSGFNVRDSEERAWLGRLQDFHDAWGSDVKAGLRYPLAPVTPLAERLVAFAKKHSLTHLLPQVF